MADTATGYTARRKAAMDKYRKTAKYREGLKRYQQKNKAALAANTRRWRSKPGNREKLNAGQIEYRLKLKRAIFDRYGDKCNCCGETNNFFLSIDHVNNDGYKDKTKSGKRIDGRMLYHKIMKEDYPDTYQILCMNCNFGKARNGGVCPHLEEVEQNG